MDRGFDWLSIEGAGVFDGIVAAITTVLDALETVFVDTPWPVVMTVIVVAAWRLAGPRVAVFTGAALAYLALFGLWETSMVTVALLGAAAFLCVLIGIPLGIWFGKDQRAYNAALPVLDFMQTMPAFVYLIPIIAFFGTGKPPGVLATIVFGMPPVIRLTALGIRGVPESTKEAAGRLRLHAVDAAQGHRDSARDAVDHDRRQSNHPDVPFHGGHRLADRGQGVGAGCAHCAPVRRQGPGDAGRSRDPVLRDGDRPNRARPLQALDRAPPAKPLARIATTGAMESTAAANGARNATREPANRSRLQCGGRRALASIRLNGYRVEVHRWYGMAISRLHRYAALMLAEQEIDFRQTSGSLPQRPPWTSGPSIPGHASPRTRGIPPSGPRCHRAGQLSETGAFQPG